MKKSVFTKLDVLPPVARLVGFRLLKMARGTAVCEMTAGARHRNTVGTVHGGILCDLSDATMGDAFTSTLAPGQKGVTVEFKINFLRAALPGDRLRARAKTIWRGRSLSYLECEIRNGPGRLLAKASSTCKIKRGQAKL